MRKVFNPILLIPLLLFIILRIPSVFEGYWYGDEGIYAAVAQEIFEGKKLYQEVWDHKPPFIFLIYYLGAVLGWEIGWPLLKVFNIILGMLTIGTVFFTLFKLNLSKVPIFVGLFFLSWYLGSTVLEGNSLNAEVVFILFNVLAFRLLLSKKHPTAVGFLLFLSFITKVPGFVEMALVLMAFSIYFWREEGLVFIRKFLTRVSTGFTLPLIVLLLYFYFHNLLDDFIYANFIFNAIYSLHENNYLSVFDIQIPNTLLKFLSVIGTFGVSLYWYWKKRLSGLAFLIINLFVAQVFGSLLSGKNYGHYFIQVLPGAALLIAFILHKLRERLSLQQAKIIVVFLLLFLPLYVVFKSLGEIPKHAPVREYYSAFYTVFILRNNERKEDFRWRYGDSVHEATHFADYLNQYFGTEDGSIYIYTDKPWIIALVDKKITNKYVVWFHLSYRGTHLEEGLLQMANSEVVIIDNDIPLLEPVGKLMALEFEQTGLFGDFGIYKKRG